MKSIKKEIKNLKIYKEIFSAVFFFPFPFLVQFYSVTSSKAETFPGEYFLKDFFFPVPRKVYTLLCDMVED